MIRISYGHDERAYIITGGWGKLTIPRNSTLVGCPAVVALKSLCRFEPGHHGRGLVYECGTEEAERWFTGLKRLVIQSSGIGVNARQWQIGDWDFSNRVIPRGWDSASAVRSIVTRSVFA